ncbi:YxcD family protein [Ammoniphilus sp. CFH 90114]|uniref:YxcD family protein n=1 Tax=Ammoniphilus sp. CFH 90114 TaxID=2493665 RepID=UPI00100FC806|nr:YxcD family protein [Ammoniphilus sp. CFH 90114]RXT13802.1 DUF2653 family protein [Ammoniphilus sp. CFH 90114]
METIKLAEQDIVNAICLYIADKKQVNPQDVEVELMWDEQYGFSAEVFALQRQQVLIEANMIEAIRFWLHDQMKKDPFGAALELMLSEEEGITAYARY